VLFGILKADKNNMPNEKRLGMKFSCCKKIKILGKR
jgi:hypothetical protein